LQRDWRRQAPSDITTVTLVGALLAARMAPQRAQCPQSRMLFRAEAR